MADIENPHDMYFKRTMDDINTARDFILNYFPGKLKEKIDLKDMALVKNEAVNELLKNNQSDLLYRIRLEGKEAYLYFLFEHKSYLSYKISIQLLKYLAMIWDMLWQQKEKKDELPVVIPVVFYHGKEEWNIGLKLTDLLEDFPAEVKAYIPDYNFVLFDFSLYSGQEIRGKIKLRLFLEIIRYANTDEFIEHLEECLLLMKKLDNTEDEIEYIRTTVEYLLNVNEVISFEELKEKSKKIIPERSGEIMTVAERLREEGMREGMREGKKEGKKEGIEKIIYKLLVSKFGKLPEGYREKLKELNEETLEIVAEKTLEIKDLKELEKYIN